MRPTSFGILTGMLLAALSACGGAASAPPSSAPPTSSGLAASSPAAKPSDAAAPASAAVAPVSPQPASGAGKSETQTISGVKLDPLPQRTKVRLGAGLNINMLPLYYALDRGYFDKAGLDMELVIHKGSSIAILPQMARGDIDVMDTTAAPGLYNQAGQGFDVKVISSLGVPKEGRLSDIWLTVLKEKAGDFKDLKDMKGRTVEGAAQGTPIDLVVTEAIKAAGLAPGKDVTLTYRIKDNADMIALAKAKGADVIGMSQPNAAAAAKEGYVTLWKTYGFGEIAPWYQPSLMVASAQFRSKSSAALTKFLDTVLLTTREINSTTGTWRDDLMNSISKHANISPEIVKDQGAVPYYEPNGAISLESITKTQDEWVTKDQIKQKIDPQTLIDPKPLQAALQEIGKA